MNSRLWIQCACVGLVAMVFASSVSAQVLPRRNQKAGNSPAAAPAATNQETPDAVRAPQRTGTTTTVETREGQAVDAAVEAQATPGRVRTRVNQDVTRSAGSAGTILRTTQIVGTVVNVQDRRVGQITDIVLSENGCISYVVVEMNGRMAPIPWHVGNYSFQDRVFVIEDFDQARLERIPTFTRYEQLADQAFVSQVTEYFGVEAGADVDGRTNLRTTTDAQPNATSRERTSTQTDAKTRTSDDATSTKTESRSTSDQKKNAAASDQKRSSTKSKSDVNRKSSSASENSADKKNSSEGASKSRSSSKSDAQPTTDPSSESTSDSQPKDDSKEDEGKAEKAANDDPAETDPNAESDKSDKSDSESNPGT